MKKSKILVSSMLVIALCVSLIAGTTFALFTSESSVNIAVTSGKVNVEATITEGVHSSTLGGNAQGTVKIVGREVSLDKIMPGDVFNLVINVKNNSTVAAKMRTNYLVEDGYLLANGLDVKVTGMEEGKKFKSYSTAWEDVADKTVNMQIALPQNADNMYQGLSAKLSFAQEAVQANGVDASEEVTFELLPEFTRIGKDTDSAAVSELFASNQSAYVVLEDDYTSTQSLNIPYDMPAGTDKIIELNNKTLTMAVTSGEADALVLRGNGNVLIHNGTIVDSGVRATSGGRTSINIQGNVNLKMEDITFVAKRAGCTNVIAENGTMKGSGDGKTGTFDTVSCFKNCKFVAEKQLSLFAYVYLASSYAQRTFENCDFSGEIYTSLVIRGGTTEIKGGSYIGMQSKVFPRFYSVGSIDAEAYFSSYVNNAIGVAGDAILILENCSASAYKLESVTIDGAEIKVGTTAENVTFADGLYKSGALAYGIRHLNALNDVEPTANISVSNVTYYQGGQIVEKLAMVNMAGEAVEINPFVQIKRVGGTWTEFNK